KRGSPPPTASYARPSRGAREMGASMRTAPAGSAVSPVRAKPPARAGAPDALAGVRGYLARSEHLVIGLMTGTSGDAVDAALVGFTGHGLASRHAIVAYRESPLEEPLRREILDVAAAQTLAPERLMRLDAALGERYAAAVLELLAEAGVEPAQVSAIGCHRHAVRPGPRRAP